MGRRSAGIDAVIGKGRILELGEGDVGAASTCGELSARCTQDGIEVLRGCD